MKEWFIKFKMEEAKIEEVIGGHSDAILDTWEIQETNRPEKRNFPDDILDSFKHIKAQNDIIDRHQRKERERMHL